MISYKFRLYPNKEQIERLNKQLDSHRWLYNQALEQRKTAYEQKSESINYRMQAAWLTQQRKASNQRVKAVNVSTCQRTLKRMDKAFAAFFRRVKAGETPGYPRFKGYNRFNSLEYTYSDGIKIKDGSLYVQHVGNVRIRQHRPIEGKIKTAIIKRKADKWFVCFSVEPGPQPQPGRSFKALKLLRTEESVGLDMGLFHLVITSDGEFFDAPKYLRKSLRRLRIIQRCIARRKEGSNRRHKAVNKLQRLHDYVANQRRDTAHKISRKLVDRYDLIAVENLNVSGMVKNHRLAKSISDAAWSTFQDILISKAENAGKMVVKVDPKYTSQECSGCGKIVKKDLSVRVHECPDCGLMLDRDVNAAKNILARGRRVQEST
ncbi:transposase [Candidatus Poribacteria bacterium]|nr:transposase [Candidatus Poribacteria bacterium]